MTPVQASATAAAAIIVFSMILVAFNMGRAATTVQIRSACDLNDRFGLKAGYYTAVSERP
jgi:hypothetical protein